MLSPTMTRNRQSRAPGNPVGGLAEHTMVLEQCWARSLSWRMLQIYDGGLTDKQRAIARIMEGLWAPDINPHLKQTLLTFRWWREAMAEEARLVVKLFPRYQQASALKPC